MSRIRIKTGETPEGNITTMGRRRLSRREFALPPGPAEIRRGIKGRYPINEKARAQNALGKAERFATPEEERRIIKAVHRRYPGMEIKEIKVVKAPKTKNLNVTDKLMNEVIIYGGMPMRRADVYRDALKRTGSKKAADLFAFGDQARLASQSMKPVFPEAIENVEKINSRHGNVVLREVAPARNRRYSPETRAFVGAPPKKGQGVDLGAGVVREGRRQHIKLG